MPYTLTRVTGTNAIMEAMDALYRNEVYDSYLGVNEGGLLEHYTLAHNEGEVSIHTLWIVHDKGVPIGVAAVDRGIRDVVHLYVRPEHRNQGLGQALMKAVMMNPGDRPLAGNYTSEAAHLFRRAGVAIANPERWADLQRQSAAAPIGRRLRAR